MRTKGGRKQIRYDMRGKDVLRYAFLTNETSSQYPGTMELMNSRENAEGHYLKVLVASRIARDGINVKNVQNIHLVGSEWNQSGIFQAMS